jgi:DNA-binding SARP family transcriptional activator
MSGDLTLDEREVIHDLGSILRIEAVCAVPGPGPKRGSPNPRDSNTAIEVGELPGPAGERHRSLTGGQSENNVAERCVVAWARWVEGDVAVQHGRARRDCIHDLRTDLDLGNVRGRDRAEAAGEARVLRTFLRHVKGSTSRKGLRQGRPRRLSDGSVRVGTHGAGSIISARPACHHQRQQRKSNSIRHHVPPFKLRFGAGCALTLDPANIAAHDRPFPSPEAHLEVTELGSEKEMLVLELLGTLSLRGDTGPVPLAAQQKRRLGLLAILGLGGKQGLSRDRIEAYLWPESSEARARHALDQAVYAIRRALGSDFILSTGRELRLNPEFVNSDVWEFEQAIRARDWTTAAGIYRGTLLEGFHLGDSRELESWIDTERARLLREYQTAIECLANLSVKAGDHSQSVSWWRRLAESDPLSPGPTKKLILALEAAGDRAGAVKHARHYQALVRQELEIEPDAEIEGLALTLSHPSTNETTGTATRPAQTAVAPATPAPAPREAGTAETATRALPRQQPQRMKRSRIAAVASLSVLAALLVGAVMVQKGEARDPRSRLAENAALRGLRIPVPAARTAYLLGLSAWDDRTKEGNDRAVAYFRRATELDPEYAQAYAGLAEAYVRIGYFGYRPAGAMFPKAKAAALRSVQLDSTLAPARTALATELIWEHDFTGAESEYRKAISLEPTNATAHQWYGVLLMILRRIPESVAEESRAAELEPLNLQIQNNYATFLNASGDHAGALRQFQKTVGEEPDSAWTSRNPWVLNNMARVYADNGQYDKAIGTMNRALKIVPGNSRALHTIAEIYDQMGRRDLARQAFARADTSSEQYAAYRGILYAGEGMADSAFLWFDRVEKWGIQPMLSMQADRHIDPMRSDPRYRELLRRIGISTLESVPAPPPAR